ncbi:MAG: hypothetical protein C4323_09115 [Mastigocladus sp. ERB_26_2]
MQESNTVNFTESLTLELSNLTNYDRFAIHISDLIQLHRMLLIFQQQQKLLIQQNQLLEQEIQIWQMH